MARVQVSDEIWAAYRAALGSRPVSVALGELVTREVGRSARRSAGDVHGMRLALDDARQLADELTTLVARFERASGADVRTASDVEASPHGGFPRWADSRR
jgi:hypothetical protein